MCIWMAALFLFGRSQQNMGTVDVGWSGGIAIGTVVLLSVSNPDVVWRSWTAGLLLVLWSLRLSSFVLLNRVLGKEEDGRYARLRNHWGTHAERNFFWLFFELQAFLILLFLLPLAAIMKSEVSDIRIWDILALVTFVVAVGGETLADQQLTAWKANPDNRGRTCRKGLWKYSRHPNYFFEWIHWFTYPLFAVGSPWFLISLIGPICMFLFLYRVTGIPHTERQALASRGEDYRRYQETTSPFIPWPPAKQ